MNVSPYTLVYRRRSEQHGLPHFFVVGSPFPSRPPAALHRTLRSNAPLARALCSIPASLLKKALPRLKKLPDTETIGLWDLSAQVGELPAIIEALNKAQSALTFFEVHASIPTGTIIDPGATPESFAKWYKRKTGETLTPKQKQNVLPNLLFEDAFFDHARKVRKGLGLDYIVGITPAMVAFEEETEIFWNYRSVSQSRVALASTYELSGFAERSRRPFEVAVALAALVAVLPEVNPRLDFHEGAVSCVFHAREDATDANILAWLRNPDIGPECLAVVEPRHRKAVIALFDVLRTYGRLSTKS